MKQRYFGSKRTILIFKDNYLLLCLKQSSDKLYRDNYIDDYLKRIDRYKYDEISKYGFVGLPCTDERNVDIPDEEICTINDEFCPNIGDSINLKNKLGKVTFRQYDSEKKEMILFTDIVLKIECGLSEEQYLKLKNEIVNDLKSIRTSPVKKDQYKRKKSIFKLIFG